MNLDKRLVSDLRTDHAGETGAIFIYKGILAISKDPTIRRFAQHHLETETEHLQAIEALLPSDQRSLLIPVWRLAGWLTGALPAFVGSQAVYRTINAVETFVDQHYQEQIDWLTDEGGNADILAVLIKCRDDEIAHRDEARRAQIGDPSISLRFWAWLVGSGSKTAVALVRLF